MELFSGIQKTKCECLEQLSISRLNVLFHFSTVYQSYQDDSGGDGML